ncbi:MAG: hypothetical protein CMJ58_07690 [Planctomycetaceae bacterium]|nr:hypothetical protein [Planctomycetaceae bacterium]
MSTIATPKAFFPESHEQHLQTFLTRRELLRDRVCSVAKGYQVAAYINGPPGTGKTFTVCEALTAIGGKPWILRNAHMTPAGLFRFFREHPDHTLLLDDVGGLADRRAGLLILLAALDGDASRSRVITYETFARTETLLFDGGVIAMSNRPLQDDPVAKALRSRVVTLEYDPSHDEMAAYLRYLVADGYCGLTPEESRQIVEFLIAEALRCGTRLDFRWLNKAVQDYLQCRAGHSATPWQELFSSSLCRFTDADLGRVRSKKDDVAAQREFIRQLMELHPGDTKTQLQKSNMSKSRFYQRRSEVEHGVL